MQEKKGIGKADWSTHYSCRGSFPFWGVSWRWNPAIQRRVSICYYHSYSFSNLLISMITLVSICGLLDSLPAKIILLLFFFWAWLVVQPYRLKYTWSLAKICSSHRPKDNAYLILWFVKCRVIYVFFMFLIYTFETWKVKLFIKCVCLSHKHLVFFVFLTWPVLIFSYLFSCPWELDLLVICGGLHLKRKEHWNVLNTQCTIQFARQRKFIARLLIDLMCSFIPAVFGVIFL